MRTHHPSKFLCGEKVFLIAESWKKTLCPSCEGEDFYEHPSGATFECSNDDCSEGYVYKNIGLKAVEGKITLLRSETSITFNLSSGKNEYDTTHRYEITAERKNRGTFDGNSPYIFKTKEEAEAEIKRRKENK